jgi:hypothetical protein
MVVPDEFVPLPTATTVPSLRVVTPLRMPESGTGKVTILQLVPFHFSMAEPTAHAATKQLVAAQLHRMRAGPASAFDPRG